MGRVWGRIATMADAEAAVAQSRSSRTYEDALVALNTLITRKADAPITDPVTGVLNWQTHFQSLFQCLEVCARSLLLAHSSLVCRKLSHTLAFRISFAIASTLPDRTSGNSFFGNFRILDFVVWSFARTSGIATAITWIRQTSHVCFMCWFM